MAETTGISWCRSTWNPWMGCTKVGPGCDNCYASVSTPVRTMAIVWGAGQPRKRTSAANWKQVDRWNEQAPSSEFAGRKGFWPVFSASLADVWDNEVPIEWLVDYLDVVRRNTNLTFLIVTKRIGNVRKRLMEAVSFKDGVSQELATWIGAWLDGEPPAHVWLIITVVNQDEADRDIAKLLATPAAVRGLSVEPQLGAIDLTGFLKPNPGGLKLAATCSVGIECRHGYDVCPICDGDPPAVLDWVICGGESKQGGADAREFALEWAIDLARQTKKAGVAFFMKQAGHNPTLGGVGARVRLKLTGKGADPSEWPEEIQRQEFPEVARG